MIDRAKQFLPRLAAASLVLSLVAISCAKPQFVPLERHGYGDNGISIFIKPGQMISNQDGDEVGLDTFVIDRLTLILTEDAGYRPAQNEQEADAVITLDFELRIWKSTYWYLGPILIYTIYGLPYGNTEYLCQASATMTFPDGGKLLFQTTHGDKCHEGLYNSCDSFRHSVLESSVNALANRLISRSDEIARLAAQNRAMAAAARTPAPPLVAVAPPPADIDLDIPPTNMRNPDGIAVIIGNKDYQGDIPPVDYAIRDAESVKQYLLARMGYQEENIILVANATQARLIALFGDAEHYQGRLYSLIKPGLSDVFIYYSGHGAPDVETGRSYFVPVDADSSTIKLNGYSLETFYANIARLPARQTVVVIDACFSGGSQQGMIIRSASPVFIETRGIISGNAAVLTSGSAGQISSWYQEKGHGLFTYFFLKGLRGEGDLDRNGEITIDELYRYLSDQTGGIPYWARRLHNREQTPDFSGVADLRLLTMP